MWPKGLVGLLWFCRVRRRQVGLACSGFVCLISVAFGVSRVLVRLDLVWVYAVICRSRGLVWCGLVCLWFSFSLAWMLTCLAQGEIGLRGGISLEKQPEKQMTSLKEMKHADQTTRQPASKQASSSCRSYNADVTDCSEVLVASCVHKGKPCIKLPWECGLRFMTSRRLI